MTRTREGPLLTFDVSFALQAAQGIGRATAILFAQHGAKVVVADLDESKFVHALRRGASR